MLLDDIWLGNDVFSGGEWGFNIVSCVDWYCNESSTVKLGFNGDCTFTEILTQSDCTDFNGVCDFTDEHNSTGGDSTAECV